MTSAPPRSSSSAFSSSAFSLMMSRSFSYRSRLCRKTYSVLRSWLSRKARLLCFFAYSWWMRVSSASCCSNSTMKGGRVVRIASRRSVKRWKSFCRCTNNSCMLIRSFLFTNNSSLRRPASSSNTDIRLCTACCSCRTSGYLFSAAWRFCGAESPNWRRDRTKSEDLRTRSPARPRRLPAAEVRSLCTAPPASPSKRA